MAFSLYAATIPSYRQILESVAALLNTAEGFCSENRLPHDDIIQARLPPVPMCSETSAFGSLESKGSIHSCQQ
jgi:hypothetical protein